jgi:hypothetical protein
MCSECTLAGSEIAPWPICVPGQRAGRTAELEGASIVNGAEPKQPDQARSGGVGGRLPRGGELEAGETRRVPNRGSPLAIRFVPPTSSGRRCRRRRLRPPPGNLLRESFRDNVPVETNRPDRAEHPGGVAKRQRAADSRDALAIVLVGPDTATAHPKTDPDGFLIGAS